MAASIKETGRYYGEELVVALQDLLVQRKALTLMEQNEPLIAANEALYTVKRGGRNQVQEMQSGAKIND